MQLPVDRATVATLLAADLSDASADRRIYLAAAGLALLGLVMALATAWWWRATRPDHPSLGPLEVMSRSRFATLSDSEQRAALDAARPPTPGADTVVSAMEPPVDLRRTASEPLPPVDDLLDLDDLREVDDTDVSAQRPSVEIIELSEPPATPGEQVVDGVAHDR